MAATTVVPVNATVVTNGDIGDACLSLTSPTLMISSSAGVPSSTPSPKCDPMFVRADLRQVLVAMPPPLAGLDLGFSGHVSQRPWKGEAQKGGERSAGSAGAISLACGGSVTPHQHQMTVPVGAGAFARDNVPLSDGHNWSRPSCWFGGLRAPEGNCEH